MSKTITIPDEVFQRLERQATARGVTIAEMLDHLVEEAEHTRITSAIEQMQVDGLLVSGSTASARVDNDFELIEVQGTPLSQIIVEERR